MDTESDGSSSSSEGERSLPATSGEKSAYQKKPTESVKAIDSGSESEDSGSDIPPKPLASKAMDDGAKHKKPRSKPNSKPVASPSKTPTKRGAAVGGGRDSKKLKKEKGEGVCAVDEGKKSVLFQRLWSDDDEIVILKGMLEYKEEKGADPMADANDFHDFIRKSLHVDVDRRQVVDKVRRLRKRYHNSVGKKSFSSHEKAAFELSKKIWGNKVESTDADQPVKSNVETAKISKSSASMNPSPTIATPGSMEMKGVENSGSGQEKAGSSWQFIGKASISMGLDENIVKLGLELCRKDKKAEIEEKWRQLHLEESNLFSRKLDLAREESKMITEAFRSAGK